MHTWLPHCCGGRMASHLLALLTTTHTSTHMYAACTPAPTPTLCPQAFLVQRDTKREQLEEVLEAFGLAVNQEDVLSRW